MKNAIKVLRDRANLCRLDAANDKATAENQRHMGNLSAAKVWDDMATESLAEAQEYEAAILILETARQ